LEARQSEGFVRNVEYEKNGRKYIVQLPDKAPDSDAPKGIPVGPPDIDGLISLPEPFSTRLHNELFARGIFTLSDTMKHQNEIRAALQAAFRIDVSSIQEAYQKFELLKAQEV
jgi:hypothetical protein